MLPYDFTVTCPLVLSGKAIISIDLSPLTPIIPR